MWLRALRLICDDSILYAHPIKIYKIAERAAELCGFGRVLACAFRTGPHFNVRVLVHKVSCNRISIREGVELLHFSGRKSYDHSVYARRNWEKIYIYSSFGIKFALV